MQVSGVQEDIQKIDRFWVTHDVWLAHISQLSSAHFVLDVIIVNLRRGTKIIFIGSDLLQMMSQ